MLVVQTGNNMGSGYRANLGRSHCDLVETMVAILSLLLIAVRLYHNGAGIPTRQPISSLVAGRRSGTGCAEIEPIVAHFLRVLL